MCSGNSPSPSRPSSIISTRTKCLMPLLAFSWINPSSKGISHLVRVAMIDEGREGEGLFPEHIDHVFKIIDRLLAENLMIAKRVFPVSPLTLQIFTDNRCSELRLAHGHG